MESCHGSSAVHKQSHHISTTTYVVQFYFAADMNVKETIGRKNMQKEHNSLKISIHKNKVFTASKVKRICKTVSPTALSLKLLKQ